MPLTSDRDRGAEMDSGREAKGSSFLKAVIIISITLAISTLLCVLGYIVLKGG